ACVLHALHGSTDTEDWTLRLNARTVREGRHWNNDGIVEDVATGSVAVCAAAYLRKHGRIDDGIPAVLHQGRFTGRPSEMTITAFGQGEDIRSAVVGGDTVLVGSGQLSELPQ